jgi:parallel beta-helix repeat protein
VRKGVVVRTHFTVLTVLVAVLLLAGTASAKTIKVPGDFATPQTAIANAQPGDKVLISEDFLGTVLVTGKTGITIQGKKKATLDGDGGANVMVVTNCTDVTITGLRFTNSTDHGVTIADSADVTFAKCVVEDVNGHGIAIGSSQRITVEKSTFEDCGVDGINLDVDLTGTPPSNCEISKNTVSRPNDDGIDVTGNGHVIAKNKVDGAQRRGILVDDSAPSSGATIEKNTVEDCGEHGIQVDGSGHFISKNKIDEAGDDGIRVNGDSCNVTKNKITDSDDDGIDVEGDLNGFEKNKISGSGGDGFDVDGDTNTFTGNKVSGSGDDGMEVEADNNLVLKNTFSKNGDHGIVVQEGADNVFDKNKATKNDDDDIWTDVPVGDNTWGDNKYGTGNVEP